MPEQHQCANIGAESLPQSVACVAPPRTSAGKRRQRTAHECRLRTTRFPTVKYSRAKRNRTGSGQRVRRRLRRRRGFRVAHRWAGPEPVSSGTGTGSESGSPNGIPCGAVAYRLEWLRLDGFRRWHRRSGRGWPRHMPPSPPCFALQLFARPARDRGYAGPAREARESNPAHGNQQQTPTNMPCLVFNSAVAVTLTVHQRHTAHSRGDSYTPDSLHSWLVAFRQYLMAFAVFRAVFCSRYRISPGQGAPDCGF